MKPKALVWIEQVREIDGEPIGSIELFDVFSGDIPEGWAIMDGKSNVNPGSGLDKSDKFAPLPTLSKTIDEYCGDE